MNGKILIYLLGIAGFFGLAYGVNQTLDVDELRADARSLAADLKSAEANLESRRRNLEQLRDQLALQAAVAELKGEVEALQKRVAEAKSAQAGIEKSYVESVQRVRANSEGLKLSEVQLAGGKVLRLAKIQKIESDGVTFAHVEGILRVTPDELPADLKARLGYVLEMPVKIPSP